MLNKHERKALFVAMQQSLLGKCYKRGVGSVVYDFTNEDEPEMISVGHNRAPHSHTDCFKMGNCLRESFHGSMDSIYRFQTCRALHSEQVALMDALRRTNSTPSNPRLFVSRHPCLQCARYAIEAGVTHVYYVEPRAEFSVHEELSRGGVTVISVSQDEADEIIDEFTIHEHDDNLKNAISENVFRP